jgi:hypothetical protein
LKIAPRRTAAFSPRTNLPGKNFLSTPHTEIPRFQSRNSYRVFSVKDPLLKSSFERTQTSAAHPASESIIAATFFEPSNSDGTEDGYHCRNSTEKGEKMKRMLFSIALAVVASVAWGQTTRQPLMKTQDVPQRQQTTSTTTTTTEGSGTITEFSPGSAIVLKESSGPRHYRFGKTVTYVTRSGKVLDEDTVRTRVKVGVPVRVHYTGTGDNMMVDRVILDED